YHPDLFRRGDQLIRLSGSECLARLRLCFVNERGHRVARGRPIARPRRGESIVSVLQLGIEAIVNPSLQVETSDEQWTRARSNPESTTLDGLEGSRDYLALRLKLSLNRLDALFQQPSQAGIQTQTLFEVRLCLFVSPLKEFRQSSVGVCKRV